MKEKLLGRVAQAIAETESNLKEANAEFNGHMQHFKKLLLLIKKYEGKTTFTDEEIKEAQAVTCYGNLAYCCGTAKPCLFRDTALLSLGITADEFNTKTKWVDELLESKKTPQIVEEEPKTKLTTRQKDKIKKLDTKELKKQKVIVPEEEIKEDFSKELKEEKAEENEEETEEEMEFDKILE